MREQYIFIATFAQQEVTCEKERAAASHLGRQPASLVAEDAEGWRASLIDLTTTINIYKPLKGP